jgi:hypothetical protein
LLCGALRWLTDHDAKSYQDRIIEIISKAQPQEGQQDLDPDEPAWVRDHRKKLAEREAAYVIDKEEQRRKKHQERLEQIRRQYSEVESRGFSKRAVCCTAF